MYRIIMGIQILCIFLTISCFYFTLMGQSLRTKVYRDSVLLTLLATVVVTCGYGLFLQTISLGGLQVAQKIVQAGKMFFSTFLLMTYMSEKYYETQSLDEDSSPQIRRSDSTNQPHFFQSILIVIAFTFSIFISVDALRNFVTSGQNLAQNQYFYYIEETLTGLGRSILIVQVIFYLAAAGLALTAKNTKSALLKTARVLVAIMPIAAICISALPISRHYDLSSMAICASAICLTIIETRGEIL